MMVLADTSVWSLALRRREDQEEVETLIELIEGSLVVMIGPVRQELLSGISDTMAFEKLRTNLQAFDDLPLTTADYETAADFGNICRRNGINGPYIDFLICSVAYNNNLLIFTTDQDFERYAKLLPIRLLDPKATNSLNFRLSTQNHRHDPHGSILRPSTKESEAIMTTQNSKYVANLTRLFEHDYLPLMSCTLVLTQHPVAAEGAVRAVFTKAAQMEPADCTPAMLFKEMLRIGPSQVTALGHNPAGFVTLGAKNNIADFSPGKRFPLELPPIQPNPGNPMLPGKNLTGMDTVERWVLYPLIQDEADEHKKANKAKLLQWLSQLVNNGKIIAILGEWLGYSPGAEGADGVLAVMASLTGLDIERTHQIWQTQNELWQQIFAESE
ncbi:MAG: PIN domain-containing protein, partial [Symbiobacteriaceae bacterium]|nr:PIN domain-containing protein [Symbiobacteriaceae bacterium]